MQTIHRLHSLKPKRGVGGSFKNVSSLDTKKKTTCLNKEKLGTAMSHEINKTGPKCFKPQASHRKGKHTDIAVVSHEALRSLDLVLTECKPHVTRTSDVHGKDAAKSCEGILEVKSDNCSFSTTKKSHSKSGFRRLNEIDIQMLSKPLFQQLFGKDIALESPSPFQVEKAREELLKHGLLNNEKSVVEDVDFKLPQLEGGNIEEHFYTIGEQQCAPYRQLLNELILDIPKAPEFWVFQPGWTKYSHGTTPHSVPFPQEDAIVFDVEVCQDFGQLPTLATAVSRNAWYAWVSHPLAEDVVSSVGQAHYITSDLIPLESGPLENGVGGKREKFKKHRVVVGHNVSFDRARVKEQYWLEGSGTRFVDTMSLHICVSGITSFQRAMLKSSSEAGESEDEWRKYSSLNSLVEVYKLYCGSHLDKGTRELFMKGTLSDIKEHFQELMSYCASDVVATHRVLCQLLPMFLERFPHPVTLAGMLELSTAYLPVNSNWNRYISDAQQTFEDLDNEARFLLARRANKACQLLHENKYREDLWLWDLDWSVQELQLKKATSRNKKPLKDTVKEAKGVIEKSCTSETNTETEPISGISVTHQSNHLEGKLHDRINESDFSDTEEDSLAKRFHYLEQTRELLPARMPHLPGYPAWYRKLCHRYNQADWIPGPKLISSSMQVTPKLLSLTWESYPLHYIRNHGWGLLVPYCVNTDTIDKTSSIPLKQLLEQCYIPNEAYISSDLSENKHSLENLEKDIEDNLSWSEFFRKKGTGVTQELPKWYQGTGIWCNVDVGGCCWFLKLPHKDGGTRRVGNPLAKDFLSKFSENVLSSADAEAEKILDISRKLSYWRNNHERVEQQMVIWLCKKDLPYHLRKLEEQFGAIIPQIVVCGTLTRRAVEPTWMTASNAQKGRVGSELRSMVQAPPGYSIVGADVDSQELWIASIIGDAHFSKMHGATPLGWMTLSGRKSDGTDMHSITARAVGISRDHAKVINYARIYGAGQKFAERLLKQFNPTMATTEARNKASKMFALTKGQRVYRLQEEYRSFLEDRLYTLREAANIRAQHGLSLGEMFHPPQWVGGTESAMFNRLEEIANSPTPATPFLGGRLSRALEPANTGDDQFLPTRVNWVVQSGAVDFLHLMLVCMRWLHKSEVRFCLSFHDEVRYLVPQEQRYRVALAMHITNLLVRSFCAYRLGLFDLPQSVAFFTSVEVDTVLRKEAHQDCITPSNPHGLLRSYGIPQGESLDIQQALQKVERIQWKTSKNKNSRSKVLNQCC